MSHLITVLIRLYLQHFMYNYSIQKIILVKNSAYMYKMYMNSTTHTCICKSSIIYYQICNEINKQLF